MLPVWRGVIAVSTLTFAWSGWAAAGQAPARAQEQPKVRGAHTEVKNPEKTFTDEIGLTVPAAPIDHPGRVYPASDDFPTGPAVGERLPDFTLSNQHGEPIDFHRDREGRKAVVVFFRSAVW
jgi:hypothetical protein